MLNPIKTFFNFLQKNSSNSNSFKDDLSMADETSSQEGADSVPFEDPLTDPLAIDDDFGSVDAAIPLVEPENVSIDNVIFVDIEELKCKVKDVKDNESKLKSSRASDINGNNRHSLEVKRKDAHEKELVTNGDKVATKPSEDELNKSADSSLVTSVNSSEPETDQTDVTDTSVLLEEIRSDGSDSGLGSDSLRSISEIEKNLAALSPSKSNLKRRSVDNLHEEQAKKPKRSINFGDVTVFYFPRCQGFGCVPTAGGSTLGMTAKHAYKKSFSLTEHAVEQRRLYRLKMAGNDLNGSSSSSDESKSEDEVSEISLSEGDSEAYGFLQPVTTRQRRALLKSAGVRKIDTMEKDECRQLRTSREVCGCTCRGYCDPDTCECSQAGIKCQVDRIKPHEFPCGCTRDGCGNVNGRVEFNPARVKTHFIHTIMRLELEKRQEMSEDSSASVIQNHKWWSQMRQSPASPSCSYSNYSNYSNATSQYPPKIPPISTMATSPVQESLDLHYAYEYIGNSSNSLSLNTESASSSFNSTNGSDYYANYNYLSPTTPFQNGGYPLHHLPPQQTPHVPYQSQLPQSSYPSDCQYSNYTPTNGSGRFHARIDTSAIESVATQSQGFMSNYPSTVHNGSAANHSRINYQSTIPPQDNHNHESYCAVTPLATPNSIATTNINDSGQAEGEANENLSEIIKKSIVESVTA